MQAIQYSEFSKELDVTLLNLVTVAKPVVNNPGTVLVKIHAAASNPVDTKVFQGFSSMIGWSAPLPFTPGYDFSGVIETVSEDVKDFKAGDEVLGFHWGDLSHTDEFGSTAGAFAEYLVVPVRSLYKKPAALSFTQAAALPCIAATATGPLDLANLTTGSKVLILGGSTAVGSCAIQLAKRKGAWVATTSSTRSLEYVSQFGADHIINYNEKKWWDSSETGLSGFDAIFDCASDANILELAKTDGLVKEGGSLITVWNHSLGVNPTAHQPRFGYAGFVNCVTVYERSKVLHVIDLVASGQVKVHVEKVYPFTKQGAMDLFARAGSGKALGKQVIQIVEA